MAAEFTRLVSEILNRYFGDIVQKVGIELMKSGSQPIASIVKNTNLPRNKVVDSLRALLKYDLISYEPSHHEGTAEYQILSDNVLLLLRYPRYLLNIKTKFGTQAELILEETLQNGSITVSNLLLNIARKYKDDKEKNITIATLREILISLVTAGYLVKAPVADTKDKPPTEVPVLMTTPSVVPQVDVRLLLEVLASGDTSPINDDVYWKVNFDRLHQDFRDEIMIKAMTARIDENAGELMRHLLLQMYVRTDPWSPVSNPIPTVEVRDSCRLAAKHHPLLQQYLDQYLKLLEENGCGFVSRAGDAGGGQWRVQLAQAALQVACALLDHTVAERLGSNAARIFRLIREKGKMEEDEIQKCAMLPNKECKELTYKLMVENFITVQPTRAKSQAGGVMPKPVYIYQINIHEVACSTLGLVHKALVGVAIRARTERAAGARLLDKRARVDTIVHAMRLRSEPQHNIDDIEETITPPERLVLQALERKFKQLATAELELDRSMFILHWLLMYRQNKS